MEFLSAILGELVSRSISFTVDRYCNQPLVDETLRRLRQLLLRSRAIVEEAEGRHLMNRGMLHQLVALRDEMFRGYCALDAFRYQALRGAENGEGEQVRRSPFALSRSNQAKRFGLSSCNTPSPSPSRVVSVKDLQQMVRNLEEIVGDMKEFVVFLMSYPPVHRQPYSAYLCLGKCMFGRHMEREHVIDFLLHGSPPSSQNLEVLPIVGAALVGKSTLVEHACTDERVRSYFSLILYYSGDHLNDETAATFRESCVTKHRNEAVVDARVLVVIELQGDVDDGTWKKLRLSCSPPRGSKIIITSQSEKITRLGTRQAIRLEILPFEAYWYLFKVLAFGSTDPEENPKFASMAMEIATELRGCFLCAHIGGALLQANFNVLFWRKFLMFTRDYICESQDGPGAGNAHPGYGWAIAKPKPANYFVLRDSYQKKDGGPEITLVDLLSGRVKLRGRFEVLVWRSHIPPYYSYISNCAI